MRFNKIRIPAYGPFTGLEIDLPKDGGDFHLFHGPNEAGKSSLLRSLRALLFGIHAQTPDNFLHDFNQMRIAAELEKLDGTKRLFQRRKGNKNTLLDDKEIAISESELAGFLGGVDQAYFDSMFGLGSAELRQGADALLRGEGRLGEALFSASLGGTPVDKVIASLEEEADVLFRGRASSRIRQGRKQLDDHLKASKDSIIKAEAWEEIQKAIEQMTEKRAKLIADKQDLNNRKSWLERCRDALPVVGQLRECQRQQSQIPAMPELGEQFGEDIREARMSWAAARDQIEPLKNELTTLQTKAAVCELAPEVLAVEAEIERLHAGLGVFLEQEQGLAEKCIEATQALVRIEAACKELEIATPIEELESCRISKVKFTDAQHKAADLTKAKKDLESAEQNAKELERTIKDLKKSRAGTDAGDITAIEQSIARSKGLEEIAKGLEARIVALSTLRLQMEDLRSHLSNCPAELEQIPSLDIPLNTTIERFRDELDELKHGEEDLDKRRSEERGKADTAKAEMDRLARQREIPSLEDLKAARSHRERGWDLVLKEWKGSGEGEVYAEGVPLEEAYPKSVAAADDVADHLRTEAEAVAQMEEKRVQLTLAENALSLIQAQAERLANGRTGLEARWIQAWEAAGVSPLSPREMFEWRDRWEDLRRAWNQWCVDTKKLTQDQSAVENAVADLKKTLVVESGSLPDLLVEAKRRIDKHNKSVGKDEALLAQISDKEADLHTVNEALPKARKKSDDAQSVWKTVRSGLSLPETLSPEDAIDLLRSRKELFVEYDQWRALSQECQLLESKISSYQTAITRLTTQLDLESRDSETDEKMLWKLLEKAKSAQNSHDELQRRIQETDENLADTGQRVAQFRAAFETMLQAASLADEAKVDEFSSHFEEKKKIDDRLRILRESLAGSARGETIEAFIEKVENENEQEDSLTAIDGKITELDLEIESIRNELQEFTNQRKKMEEASDESAREAQLAELASSRIQQDGERFVRLQLAITLLKSRIDRFREQNQGPFMEKASHWFEEITGEAFSGIITSYDDGDQPVIAGQRSGNGPGRTVPIGGMSEGTRDQLYLALRLAGLELHLADHEPMPLILDDLLVHFDDERALRALTALRDFGQRSQVLLFTHHAHLVQLAENQWGKTGFHLHALSTS